MHIPLTTKKSEKRKASITSAASEDGPVGSDEVAPIETKTKQRKPKQKRLRRKDRTVTPENPHPQALSPPLSRSASASVERIASPPRDNDTMLRKSYVKHTHTPSQLITHSTNTLPRSTTNSATPEHDTPPPRRSQRLRNSISSISETWHKARPYIERINGTIMPLEHQGDGAKAYYGKDGVKM